MVRTLRLFLLFLLVAIAGLAWPADAAAQRGPAHSGRVGVAVARPAGGPHGGGGYGYHAPYYPARYYPPAYYSYPRYYAPYSWAVGFGFGAGWSASFGVYGYPYGYAYPYRYPAAYAYPYAYGYPPYGATVVHVVPRNAPASPQDRSQYDSPASSGAPRSADQSAFATLSLRISPADAEILIDGEAWDRANGDSRFTIDLAAGRHQLEVRREGYGAYVRTIDLLGGRTAALNVALTPKEPVPAPAPARYPVSAPVPVRVARR